MFMSRPVSGLQQITVVEKCCNPIQLSASLALTKDEHNASTPYMLSHNATQPFVAQKVSIPRMYYILQTIEIMHGREL
jgi:hypothetical protein